MENTNFDTADSNKKNVTSKHNGIETSRVINADYLKSLGDIYKCNICFNVMLNPTDCEKCGHSFCQECISHFKCPFNCDTGKFRPSSVGIKTLLSILVFKCTHEGCEEKVPYSSIITHDMECGYKTSKCPHPKCGLQLPRKNLEHHIKDECRFLLIKCKNCGYDFYRQDYEVHFESCDQVYKSLTGQEDISDSEVPKKKLNTKNYLEALNLNIAKIIKENSLRFKTVEEDTSKLKEDLTTTIEKVVQKAIETKPNQPPQEASSLEKISDGAKKEICEEITFQITKIVVKNIEIVLKNLLTIENTVYQIQEDTKHSAENSLTMSKNHNEMKAEISEDIQLKLRSSFDLLLAKFQEMIDTVNFNINKLQEKIEGHVQALLESEGDISSEVQKTTSKIIKNIIEVLDDKNNEKGKDTEHTERKTSVEEKKEMQEVIQTCNAILKNEITQKMISSMQNLSGDMENIATEIRVGNKCSKDIKAIITEEFAEIADSYKQIEQLLQNPNAIPVNYSSVVSSADRGSSELCNVLPDVIIKKLDIINTTLNETNKNAHNLSEKFTFLSTKLEQLSDSSIFNSIDTRLDNISKDIETKFEMKLKEMYNLKWCNECEKVDYFFGFIKCQICLKENCKQCVLLCSNCKNLLCKKCTICPRCQDLSCLNCRSSCQICSNVKKLKYCINCLKSCTFCHKVVCQDCIKQCISCKSLSCEDCSRNCNMCNKNSCRRCETFKNFKTCSNCHQTSCNECVIQCKSCDLGICKKCLIQCKLCKKEVCKKCANICDQCQDSFCSNCTKEFTQSRCNVCKKQFCINCTKNLRKCKKCSQIGCKDCCVTCKKCRNLYCNECNTQCDNCINYICATCVYKCVCDKLIFCEKCLLDINPIGPHECVLWMNESPVFSGIKSRSKIQLPSSFEAKFYLERYTENANLLIGVTDNDKFTEDTVSFVDNIWAFKAKSGQKYSSQKSLEHYYDKECREGFSILVALKTDNLYFRVNSEDSPPAFILNTSGKNSSHYWLYIENDAPLTSIKVRFVYIRKI